MSSIGGYAVFSISGHVPLSTLQVEHINRPGLDGHDTKVLGVRGSKATLHVVARYASAANRLTGLKVFNALVNRWDNPSAQTLTVIDDQATTWTNLSLQGIYNVQMINEGFATDASNYRLEFDAEFMSLATSYL